MHKIVDGRIELDDGELFPREVELHFADAYDKLLRATEGLETSRELLGGVRDYFQAKIANDQNEVTKRLTAIASLLLVPTFIVGLYGQNFRQHPGAPLGLRLRVVVGADRRDDDRAARLLPAQGLDLSHGRVALGTLDRVPYFICPRCKTRRLDDDGCEGLTTQPPACQKCGFAFTFQLLEDYYPAQATGFIVTDQDRRVLATGEGVFELTGFSEGDLLGPRRREALDLSDSAAIETVREWGVRKLDQQLSLRTRAASRRR